VETPTPFTQEGTESGGADRYELLEEIQRGGMGVVYKARDRRSGRIVALKTMQANTRDRPDLTVRFEREIRAAARLTHPNIIPIYDVGLDRDGRPFFTMAYAPGGSLGGHGRTIATGPRAAVTLVEKIARAIEQAHQQDIVHRDLKPSNILLDEAGEPLVSDFGLAKILSDDEELTRTGDVLGTPAYMAPEQAAGQATTPATDVWALGVILYELLAGRRPFPGPGRDLVLEQVRSSDPPRLQCLNPELDSSLERIVWTCLAKDPAGRYPSAGPLAADLRRWLSGEAIPPQGESRLQRIGRTLRRHPIASAVVAGLCAAAVVLLVMLSLGKNADGPPTSDGRMAIVPIVFLGESGRAARLHWLVGEKDVTVQPSAANEPFSFDTSSICVLDLGIAPPWPRYRFRAEVRQDDSDDGKVGLCFGYQECPPGQEGSRGFCALTFADRGRRAGSVELRILRLPEANPTAVQQVSCLPPQFFTPDAKATVWRKLTVEVVPQEIRVFWKEGEKVKQLGAPSPEELNRLASSLFPDPPGPGWEFKPGGTLGLYLDQGTASFRNVVLEKMDSDD
jgi:tRNA A-37 threonylcarbamoyl transferase component Bud32